MYILDLHAGGQVVGLTQPPTDVFGVPQSTLDPVSVVARLVVLAILGDLEPSLLRSIR